MKKVIAIIFISILLLTACHQTPPFESENAQKYQYFYFENLDWGMSRDECVNQLKVNEMNFLPIDEKLEYDNYSGFKIAKEVYGYPAYVTCMFASKLGEYEGEFGLITVIVEFEKGNYDMNTIFDAWDKTVGYESFVDEMSQNEPLNIFFHNKTSINMIEDETVQAKAEKLMKQINPDGRTFGGSRLSVSRFYHDPDVGATISFNGGTAAVLNYALKQ